MVVNTLALFLTTQSQKAKKAYIWNSSHTKRLHNLKNYPSTIWLVSNAFVRQVKGNNEVYYKLYSAYNPKLKGTVWSGYLKKNLQKLPPLFDSSTAYANYLKTSRATKLSKLVAQLFPNTPIDLTLSNYAYETHESLIKNFSDVQRIAFDDNRLKTQVQKMAPSVAIKYIENHLNALGYTADKRQSMTKYYIGITIAGNSEAMDNPTLFTLSQKSRYPTVTKDLIDLMDYSHCTIVLGIPK